LQTIDIAAALKERKKDGRKEGRKEEERKKEERDLKTPSRPHILQIPSPKR
jgi:hypothetical protein